MNEHHDLASTEIAATNMLDHPRRRLAGGHEAQGVPPDERSHRRIGEGGADEARRVHGGDRRTDDVEGVSANQ